MFGNKLVDLLYFDLGQWEESSRESARGARVEFDGVVPDRMRRESLGLLLAKDFGMPSVASRDFLVIGGLLWGV